MLVILHGEFALALRHRPQASAVTKHLRQRDVCFNDNLIALSLAVLYQAFASIDIAYDGPLKLVWCTYLHTEGYASAASRRFTIPDLIYKTYCSPIPFCQMGVIHSLCA